MRDRDYLLNPSDDSLASWLIDWLVREFKIDRESVKPNQAFLSFGMDSVQAMTMVGDLESELSVRLPPTLVWDYPTIGELAAHLAERLGEPPPIPVEAAAAAREFSSEAAEAELESLLGELDPLGHRLDRRSAESTGVSRTYRFLSHLPDSERSSCPELGWTDRR